MRKPLNFLLVFLFSLQVFAQEHKPIKWAVRPSAGKTFPLTTLPGGHITDGLIGFSGNTYYWQLLSVSWFFSNNWGAEFFFNGNHASSVGNRYNRFVEAVEQRFGDEYYTTPSSGAIYPYLSALGGSIERGGIGPVYKIEKGNFLFIGRAMIGVTSFYTDFGYATLKEKGGNERLHVHWSARDAVKDYFTFNPSFTFGYRLSRRIVLDFDFNYWLYHVGTRYTETITNQYTKEISKQTFQYSGLINEISLGAGFMFILR
jgi:hypothetical protein